MRISDDMDLHQLMERMGSGATLAAAKHMRATLDGLGRYSDTVDVPKTEWALLCDAATVQAKYDDDGADDVSITGPVSVTRSPEYVAFVRIDGGSAFIAPNCWASDKVGDKVDGHIVVFRGALATAEKVAAAINEGLPKSRLTFAGLLEGTVVVSEKRP